MGQDDGLFEAVRSSHLSEVKELLEKGANPNARDEEGFTPLHYASFNGCASVAKLLLDSGADPNVGSKEGWTPLHLAASNGFTDIVKLLIECGADLDARDNEGKTALELARERGHIHIVRELLNRGAKAELPPFSIVSVEYTTTPAGEWGRILVRVSGRGRVSVVLEGDVEWITPGPVDVSGESTIEVPVKPRVAGEVPVRVTVESSGLRDSRIIWLRVERRPTNEHRVKH